METAVRPVQNGLGARRRWNDGTLLKCYPKGFVKFGVDPSDVACEIKEDITLVQDLFPSKELEKVVSGKSFDIITSIAIFYDLEDPVAFVRSVKGFKHPNLCFLQGNFLNMKFQNEFDAVVAISSIEHCGLGSYASKKEDSASDTEVIYNIHAALKEDGRLFVIVPYGKAGLTHHQRIYDAESLVELLSPFSIKKIRYLSSPDQSYWAPDTEDNVSRIDSASCGRTLGVACVIAEKI